MADRDSISRAIRHCDGQGAPVHGLTRYGYTPDGQTQTVANPFGETTTWLYDGSGRQTGQVLANGVASSTTYDPAGRPTALVYRDHAGAALAAFTPTYDPSTSSGRGPAGNRVQVDELEGTFRYGYDAANQLVDEQRTGTQAYHISYTYDPVGNRLALEQSGAATKAGFDGLTAYRYNAADELLAVTPQAPPPSDVTLAAQTPAPLSRAAYALTLPLRTSFIYTVDAATLDLIGAAGTWDEANYWVAQLATRDSAGIVSTLATGTYSSAGQGRVELVPSEPAVVDASATPRLGVSLTKVGNPPALLSVAGTASLSGALRPSSYSYDSVGNTLSQSGPSGTTTCTWDPENRLTVVVTNGESETYRYDASTSVPGKVTGLRRSKTTSGGTTHFVWDQQNVLAELDGSLARLAQYTDFPGRWGGLSARRGASSSSFYGFDLSANMRALFDSAGAASGSALYSAFGPLLSGTLSQPYGFGGQVGYYGDSDEHLTVGSRTLLPIYGRWLSRWSPYLYARNSPSIGAEGRLRVGADAPPRRGKWTDKTLPDWFKCSDPNNPEDPFRGCKPVYFTHYGDSSGKRLAVYCDRDGDAGQGCTWSDFCATSRKVRRHTIRLGDPVFPRGTVVCIYWNPWEKSPDGTTERKIDDCGCGQAYEPNKGIDEKPHPDNWMDVWVKPGNRFEDGWRCVCPGPCSPPPHVV